AAVSAAHDVRVRAARRTKRFARRRAPPRQAAEGDESQGQPDPVQRLGGVGLRAAAARAHPRVPEGPARARNHRDRSLEQGRGHRSGLRPGEGARPPVTAPVTVAVATLGCRLNQVESQQLLGSLERHGFQTVPPDSPAQVYVVNTCTVTGRADFSDRQTIRRITRDRPGALLVVTGCYAQTNPEAVARIPGVDLIVGNQEKYRLPELLHSLVKRERPELYVADIAGARDVPVAPFNRVSGRSRAFVKIQDGCQHRCAFCIVPAARGPSRRPEAKVVLEQVEALVEAGYREITLTGVDIGHYGWDLVPRTTLASLVACISETPGLRWLRLSSVLPSYFTEELIELITGSPRIAPHL